MDIDWALVWHKVNGVWYISNANLSCDYWVPIMRSAFNIKKYVKYIINTLLFLLIK